jgi:hypothetical protein
MTRREALKGLVALVGGTAAAAELVSLVQAAQSGSEEPPLFLDADQFASLGRIVDLMIPATDTPGAYAAGVHRFIDMMLSEYAAKDTREKLLGGLNEVHAASVARQARDFLDLSAAEQFDILAAVDEQAFNDSSRLESYRLLKSMILFGYYTSKPGASDELRFNPIPGTRPGCVPAETFDRAPYK